MQELAVLMQHNAEERSTMIGMSPGRVAWLTGVSGAGKSTIAEEVRRLLEARGDRVVVLDGDVLRQGLNKDLGFSPTDRCENVRRVGEVAKLMTDAGLVVIVAMISPFRANRNAVRERFVPGAFVEVHVDAPLVVAESRDVKGLYARARAGDLPNFTGIDSPYEPPVAAELVIDTQCTSAFAAALAIAERLTQRSAAR